MNPLEDTALARGFFVFGKNYLDLFDLLQKKKMGEK